MTVSPLLQRVIAGMGANAYGQAVTILIQLASLPIFLSRWDLTTYGIWLTLSAIPSYLSIADVGMVTVASNRMSMLIGGNNPERANRVFQSAQIFVLSSCLLVAIITLPLIAFAPLKTLSDSGARIALSALVICVLLSMVGGLSGAVFKATQRYAIGTGLDVTARLLEWIAAMAGLLFYGTFEAVALGMLLVRVGALFTIAYLSTRAQSEFSWGGQAATTHEIREMIKPSLGFMVFPVGNALSIQGFTLLTAHLLGPATVAIFNTYRTLARLAIQVTSILSHALWPEFSRLFGAKNYDKLKTIFYRATLLGICGAVILSVSIYAAGPILLQLWTHGKIEFLPYAMGMLLLYAAVGGSWHVPRVLLMSTNNHTRLGFIYLIVSALSLIVAWPLGEWKNLSGLIVAMIISELLMMAICFWMAARLLRHGLQDQNVNKGI